MTDPFVHDDAAYVLGALSAEERTAFEAHLRTCPDCAARVRELQDVPAQLQAVSLEDVTRPAEPVPDTLLPRLLRSAVRQRRRTRWLVSGLAAVAAACLAALIVVVWPTSAPRSSAPVRHFAALVNAPVTATATLTPEPWGTQIDVQCSYRGSAPDQHVDYYMYVYGRNNARQPVGGWLQPDHDIRYRTRTTLATDQISKIEITLPNGKPILRLTL